MTVTLLDQIVILSENGRERHNKPRKVEDATWLLRKVSDTDVTDAAFMGKPFVTNRFIGKVQAMSQVTILHNWAGLMSLESALLIDLYFQNANL